MIASAAITTGLFVLAGVVVGGLVTGSVNYVYEWRRESASARVAVRLLEAELAVAAAFVESRPEYGKWSTLMDFGTPQRSWTDYRAELARVLSTDEWEAVAVGFVGISVIERRFPSDRVARHLLPTI